MLYLVKWGDVFEFNTEIAHTFITHFLKRIHTNQILNHFLDDYIDVGFFEGVCTMYVVFFFYCRIITMTKYTHTLTNFADTLPVEFIPFDLGNTKEHEC